MKMREILLQLDSDFENVNSAIIQEYCTDENYCKIITEGKHKAKNTPIIVAYGGEIEVKVNNNSFCDIYATGDAVINLRADNEALVYVELHENAKLNFERYGVAEIKVNKYE